MKKHAHFPPTFCEGLLFQSIKSDELSSKTKATNKKQHMNNFMTIHEK